MRIARRLSAIGRIAATLALTFLLAAPPAPASAGSSVRLMIDPGHGGKDPGAVAGGLMEKKSSLQISRYVAEAARRQGWDVAMTRGNDSFVDLDERPRRAARFKATALVSVHSNSTGPNHKGFMTIYRSASSARLGDRIMRELMPQTPYGDIGNRADSRGLAVLRGAKMPAVIVELLAVTARHENAALKDPVRQRQMAEAIVRGVAKYHNVKYYPPVAPKPAAKPVAAPKPAPAAAPAPKPEAPATPATTAPAPADEPTAAPAAEKAPAPVKAEPVAEEKPSAPAAPEEPAPREHADGEKDADRAPFASVAPETSPWGREDRVIAPALEPKEMTGPTPAQVMFTELAGVVSWLFR